MPTPGDQGVVLGQHVESCEGGHGHGLAAALLKPSRRGFRGVPPRQRAYMLQQAHVNATDASANGPPDLPPVGFMTAMAGDPTTADSELETTEHGTLRSAMLAPSLHICCCCLHQRPLWRRRRRWGYASRRPRRNHLRCQRIDINSSTAIPRCHPSGCPQHPHRPPLPWPKALTACCWDNGGPPRHFMLKHIFTRTPRRRLSKAHCHQSKSPGRCRPGETAMTPCPRTRTGHLER